MGKIPCTEIWLSTNTKQNISENSLGNSTLTERTKARATEVFVVLVNFSQTALLAFSDVTIEDSHTFVTKAMTDC